MRQAGMVTTYNERLFAPISWWLSAVAFAVVWGWILLVATTWPIAIVTTAIVAAASLYGVWRYGSLRLAVDADGFRAGSASLDLAHLGDVEILHRADYRRQLGIDADARAYLVTRPYLDRGVLVHVRDDSDPTPYWLISSRRPEALATALGHTGPTSEEVTHVEEVQEG
jgi:hypothetical protein